jgi:hypothetical protein
MKGQFSVEYIVSMTIFIGFVTYIIFSIWRFIPNYLSELRNERIRSEAYQISELLINDPGEPMDWNKVVGWFDSSWPYRRNITISGSAPSDYQVLIIVDTSSLILNGKMQGDCDDIRFTRSDGVTLLDYWIESGCFSPSTKIWVKVDSIPQTIYMYYGNLTASSLSDGYATFEFFDDFEYTDSPTNHGWQWVGGSVTAQTTTTTARCGVRSLRLDGATGGNPVLVHNIGSWTNSFVAEYWSRNDATTKFFSTSDFYGGAGATPTWAENQRIYHHFRSNGFLTWYDTAYHDYMSYSANTWYEFKVIIHPSTQSYDIYVNGVPMVSGANFRKSGTDITQWGFTDNTGGYQDCVRIRKYTSPEPTYSMGPEEVFTPLNRLGLSDKNLNKTNFLSLDKIFAFDTGCEGNGYYNIKRLLGSDHDFSVFLKKIPDGILLINCQPLETITRAINVSIKRFVAFGLGRNDDIPYNFVMAHSPYLEYNPSTGEYNLAWNRTPSAAGRSIKYLKKVYEIDRDPQTLEKIKELADYLVSIQNVTDETAGWYGGFPSVEGATTYYSIDAVFGGEGLLDAYELTLNETYLNRSKAAATFLRHMQTRNEAGLVNQYYGGFVEYVNSANGAYLVNMSTKLLLAVPFLDRLYSVTGDLLYITMRDDARDFLINGSGSGYGLEGHWEYYYPQPYGDDQWHRIGTGENGVYADSVAYSLEALYEYEGLSDTVKNVYDFYQGFTNYDTRFGWAGILDVVNKVYDPLTPYYDVVNTGLLSELRKSYDWDSYIFSRRKVEKLGDKSLFWGINFDYEPITEWQNTITASAIGLLLVEPSINYGELLLQMW